MRLISFIFFASLPLAAAEPQLLSPETIQSRFLRLHSKNEERAAELANLFAEAGCHAPNYLEEALLSSKQPNIICTLPGSSPQTIVVNAHFDNRGPGEGAVDNWSGAAVLPSLFESLRGSPHRFTYQFIGFTAEEKGLIGSRDHVNRLSNQDRINVLLDVNIDCIGLAGPIRVWANRSNDLLSTSAALVGDQTKIFVRAEPLGDRYDSDATAFINWHIPAIDFHSLDRETIHLLHSKRDVRSALDPKSYYNHYRFLVAYLAYLDTTIEASSR